MASVHHMGTVAQGNTILGNYSLPDFGFLWSLHPSEGSVTGPSRAGPCPAGFFYTVFVFPCACNENTAWVWNPTSRVHWVLKNPLEFFFLEEWHPRFRRAVFKLFHRLSSSKISMMTLSRLSIPSRSILATLRTVSSSEGRRMPWGMLALLPAVTSSAAR